MGNGWKVLDLGLAKSCWVEWVQRYSDHHDGEPGGQHPRHTWPWMTAKTGARPEMYVDRPAGCQIGCRGLSARPVRFCGVCRSTVPETSRPAVQSTEPDRYPSVLRSSLDAAGKDPRLRWRWRRIGEHGLRLKKGCDVGRCRLWNAVGAETTWRTTSPALAVASVARWLVAWRRPCGGSSRSPASAWISVRDAVTGLNVTAVISPDGAGWLRSKVLDASRNSPPAPH